MASGLWAAAIPRQDGAAGDGIHLLWTALPAAGYSIGGYDVQRRVSLGEPAIDCYTLTASDLSVLHSLYRINTPVGDVALARVPCPSPPGPIPDQPVDPKGGGEPQPLQCVDFSQQRFPEARRGVFGPLRAGMTAPGAPGPVPPTVRTMGGLRGLDCDVQLSILLPEACTRIEAALVSFARPATLTALDANGAVIDQVTMSVGQRQPETLVIRGRGITSARIDAPSNETVLLRFCFVPGETTDRGCVDLGNLAPGKYANPLSTPLADCLVLGARGAALPEAVISDLNGFTGLDCAQRVSIRLARPATVVRLQLVTFVPEVHVEAVERDGTVAGVATISVAGRPQRITLSGKQLAELRIHTRDGQTRLLELCASDDPDPVTDDDIRMSTRAARLGMRAGEITSRDAAGTAARVPFNAGPAARFDEIGMSAAPGESVVNRLSLSAVGAAAPSGCLCYRVRLQGIHQHVRVTAATRGMLAIAMHEGKAVDSRVVVDPSAIQDVTFIQRSADEVLLYVGAPLTDLTVCVDVPQTPADEAADWAAVPYIAKGIQVPIRAVNAALTSAADELTLARSRLLSGESIDASAFDAVASVMNDAANAGPAAPVVHTILTRAHVDDSFIELPGWSYALTLLTEAAWRRALGFGHLDPGSGLASGTLYDYRITAHFRRRDVEETLLGFHTVPDGTTLPSPFHIGRVLFTLPSPRPVRLEPAPGATSLRDTGRKGLSLAPASPGGDSLVLAFDIPIRRVVLEMDPAGAGTLSYEARTTAFIPGLGTGVMAGNITRAASVVLDFTTPVDTLILRGSALLYGVRLSDPSAGKPDDVLDRSIAVSGVRYEATAPPAPPPVLGTTNLQEPIVAGDPHVTTQKPLLPLGFRLHWLPPTPAGGAALAAWPPDLGAFPPFDVLGFQIERRRVDVPGAFTEIGGEPTPTTFFGNRRGRGQPTQLTSGIDLLDAFPEVPPVTAPVNPYMIADDVLLSAAQPAGPPPGSLHQYRIFSVDAIGRRSAAATTGSIVRLEKHLAPPQPVGVLPPSPPAPPPPPGAMPEPTGVRARLLQKSDPDLTDADRALLSPSTNAIVLEWGWTDRERDRDPYATEFRVYFQPVAPDLVTGTLQGPATNVGGQWQMLALLNQPVPADVMKGTYLRAPAYPFKVASHTSGTAITVLLEPSVLQPSTMPDTAPFVFLRPLGGSELRPAGWPERTAVIPITAAAPQPFLFRDRFTIDAAQPAVRAWVGVSTADAQSYVPDELPAAAANGGRPGNESSIAAAVVQAHYIGRPTFTVPAALPAVPELVTSEPKSGVVRVAIDLPALLSAVTVPAGYKVVLDRLSASALIGALSRRADGNFDVRLPGGTTSTYSLANPADHAALLAAIAGGEPARVEGRFLVNLLESFKSQFEPLWVRALPHPVPFASATDELPSQADRYLYRIRLADAAEHVSAVWALVPRLVRVASLRLPGPPRLDVPTSSTSTLAVTARVTDPFDLSSLLLWSLAEDVTAPSDAKTQQKPTLLRLPDRRDLYPADGIRLRLADGSVLSPTPVDVRAAGTLEGLDLVVHASLTEDYDKRVTVWAAALTRDGIPSRVTGPLTALTGPRPLVVPALAVSSAAGLDTATWPVPTVSAEIALERTTDAGVSWTRVSPWMARTTTTISVPGSGSRAYRLALRGRGQQVTGPAVTPS